MSSRRDGQIYKKFMGVIVRMELSENLKDQFAKMVNNKSDSNSNSDDVNYGTVKVYSDGTKAVILDGSNIATPFETVTDAEDGDRVTVRVKNHKAVITGNLSSPAARTDAVKANSNKIGEFNTVLADKVGTDELDAQIGRINTLVSDNTIIKQKLSASEGEFNDIKTKQLEVEEKVTAAEADIKSIKTDKIDASIVESQYTKTKDFEALRGTVGTLSGDFSIFKNTTTDKLNATDAEIKKLDTDKLNATDAALKFANIDFSNIGVAAMQYFYAQSGLIKDVVVGNQTITGELVGVTIKGDLIDGNTIVADKLVIKGEDGLYYKLNTDGMTTEVEQTDFNSINGSVIRAKSITASKIDVKDLVAFDATIAGFKIDNTAIHSIGKESAISSVRGIYLSKDGQMAVGDSEHYIKYYKDTDGNYKLAISAESMTLSTGKTVEETVSNIQTKVDSFKSIIESIVEYQAGPSGTDAPTGMWSASMPTTSASLPYVWTRTTIMYSDGTQSVAYSVGGTPDGIQVGGRNLIQGTKTITIGNGISKNLGFQTYKNFYNGCSAVATNTAWHGISIDLKSIIDKYNLKVGDTLVYSIMTMANFTPKKNVNFALYRADNSGMAGRKQISMSPNIWYKLEFVFDITEYSLSSTEMRVETDYREDDVHYTFDGFIYYAAPKLEKGNKATDWTPAPEDIDTAIDDANDRISSANDALDAMNESFDNLSENVYRRNEVDTKISQTKEAIELSASNIYQRQDAMGNYYTVSQTDAAIKARGDAIELKVNSIQVGGRNLLQESGNFASFSKWKKYQSSASQILEVVTEDSYKIMHTFGNSSQLNMIYQLEWGTEYAYHAVIKFANAGSFNAYSPLHYWIYKTNIFNTMNASNGAHNIESINVYEYDSGKTVTSISANVWYHIVCVFKTIPKPSDYKYVLFRPFIYDSGSIVGENKEYWLRWIKLEKGNKPTDWTPAPEDVDNSISTVDSKFKDYATTASLSMYLSKTDTGQLKSMIEAIADTINITAKGGLNLKGNRFSVESTNLTIANDGSMACKNIAITGGNIDLTSAKYDDGLIRIKSEDNVCSNVITSQGFETHNSKIGLKYGYDGIMITYPGVISPGIINVSTNGNVTGNFKKINTKELDVGTMSVSNMYTSVGYNLFNYTLETQSTDWQNGFYAQFHCSGTGLLLINANVWTDSTYDYGTTYCEIIYGGVTASMSTHRFTESYGDRISANATYAVWVENANNQSFVIKGGSSKEGTKYLRMNIQAIMGLSAWRG